MRFRDLLVGLVAVLPCCASAATPEQVRTEIAARLQQQAPAADEELRAQVEQNAGAAAPLLETGRKLWTAKFRDGKSLAGCFPNGGRRIAGRYPQYDARVKRVMTLEMAINQCRKAHGEALFDPADAQTMGVVTAYARSLSDGQKIAVRVPAAAQPAFEDGRRIYFTRMGQRNFACASCHLQGAGKRYDGQVLSPTLGQATHWPEVRDGTAITLQARIRECLELMGAAPFAAGSDELNDLEYFLTYLSNGLPLSANPWRPK